MRSLPTALALAALTAGLLAAPPASASPGAADRDTDLEVYVVEAAPAELEKLDEVGLDTEHAVQSEGAEGTIRLEAVITEDQADLLRAEGLSVEVKKVNGRTASEAARLQNLAGYDVYRPYSGAGGIYEELVATAAANPKIAKLVTIGKTVQGKPIVALKLTKDARKTKDGKRPSVLYGGAQHAREWITPEMVRRLMHYYIDGYGTDPQVTRLIRTTELWFLPVSNPDGYDFTFTVDRLWRKNLQDNDGDGVLTANDGVDPNRNFAVKWGWDNEGSSIDPASETYRGTGPNSEPETKALDGLFDRVGFEFYINYHSAAELLLYGIGWQVSTPSPDDVIYEAMAGDDANPAIPGYDPDISAELYTTNGDTDTHATVEYGTLGFTPEMTTCETVSDSIPDDEWESEDCVSGFNFPDDEELIQAEFAKNVPFALSVARSTHDPDDPVSAVGLTAPDMVSDPFSVSHGTTQQVAVIAKKALKHLRLRYSVNDGRTRTARTWKWRGGERYGDTHDDYYAEFRSKVRRTDPGDSVEVWFTGYKRHKGWVSSKPFTYTVADDIGGDVLILAAEDVTGASPAQGVTSAKYADDYATALSAAGYSSDVYDIDVNGRTVPHHLGVLSHYDAIVWESGDDIITRATGQPAGTADKLSLDLELSVRDYLNDGGKALVTGQYNQFAQAANGAYYYNPFAPPQCTTPEEYPCLPLANDFQQYWLGAYNNVSDGGTSSTGDPFPVSGVAGEFDGFAGTFNGGDSANNQAHTGSLVSTSSVLPEAEFPQFASEAPVQWVRPGAAPYDPFTGEWYMFSQWADQGWKRLSRTVDMTGKSSGELTFQMSYDTELDWDYVVVEAHEVGSDSWTTLPDANGHTTQGTGESCPEGWIELHPFLQHYQGADCSPTGTTGAWHAATGSSGGWQEWSIDLTPYAGKQVELSISYLTDWGTQGLGVFVDDTEITLDGVATETTSFEDGLGGWTAAPAPEGTRETNNWNRSQKAFDEGAVTTTDDTVFTGFGAEGLTSAEMRNDFIARAMAHLLE
ncbi:MAG TPA: M14 family zinc carboxypeptidase [Nocardioides sp.]|nr:M14 family zinc carboxypeptidase [Nocardioides sp.]